MSGPAWWAAGIELPRQKLRFAAAELDVADVEPEHLQAVVAHLRESAPLLGRLPLERIVAAVAAAARTVADPTTEPGATARRALAATTGYAPGAVELALTQLARSCDAEVLRRRVRGAFGTELALARPDSPDYRGGREWVVGPGVVAVIAAGNVPGVALPAAVDALLLGCPVLVKSGSGEPALVPLFARALATADAAVGRAVAALWWRGGTEELDGAVRAAVDAVVVYGSDAAVEAWSSGGAEAAGATAVVAHGPRLSVAVVRPADDAATERLAAAVARDVCWFDQQGCLSPHGVYVVGPRRCAEAFAAALDAALARRAETVPRRRLAVEEAARWRTGLDVDRMRGADVRAAAGHAVVLEPGGELRPSLLDRHVRLWSVPRVEDVATSLLAGDTVPTQIGVALSPSELGALVAALGAHGPDRYCAVGRMQEPAAGWRHEGQWDLVRLARWVELDGIASAEGGG